MNAFPRRAGAPAMEPLTLEEALVHLKESAGVADESIRSLITVARTTCEELTERTLVSTQWRLTLDAFPDAIPLLRPPIIAVQSVQFVDEEGVLQTLDPADYLLDAVSEPAYLVPAPGKAWPATQARINAVVVSYTAGYGEDAAAVPAPLKQWMLLAIGDMYENRSATNIGNITTPLQFADALLAPYKMWGV